MVRGRERRGDGPARPRGAAERAGQHPFDADGNCTGHYRVSSSGAGVDVGQRIGGREQLGDRGRQYRARRSGAGAACAPDQRKEHKAAGVFSGCAASRLGQRSRNTGSHRGGLGLCAGARIVDRAFVCRIRGATFAARSCRSNRRRRSDRRRRRSRSRDRASRRTEYHRRAIRARGDAAVAGTSQREQLRLCRLHRLGQAGGRDACGGRAQAHAAFGVEPRRYERAAHVARALLHSRRVRGGSARRPAQYRARG